MKKKILIVVIAVVVIGGGVVAALALTGGGVSEEDKKQGEETDEGLGELYSDPTASEMPETDPALDTLEDAVDLGEFDPAAEFE